MDKLGIQLPVLVTQIVNFGILLFVLNKFLYKPILNTLAKRRREVESGIEMKKQAEKEVETTEKKRQQVLKDARQEAQLLLQAAKKDAKAAREELLKDAREDVSKLKERMEKELKAQYEKQADTLQEQTVTIAAKMVEKLLAGVLSEKDQQRLIEQQLKKLKSSYGA